jgi:hypothetical protein
MVRNGLPICIICSQFFVLPLEPSLWPGVFARACDGESAIAVRSLHQAAYRGSRNVVALGDLRQRHPGEAVCHDLPPVDIQTRVSDFLRLSELGLELRVNGTEIDWIHLCQSGMLPTDIELVVRDPALGEFAVDRESFTFEFRRKGVDAQWRQATMDEALEEITAGRRSVCVRQIAIVSRADLIAPSPLLHATSIVSASPTQEHQRQRMSVDVHKRRVAKGRDFVLRDLVVSA